MTTDPELQEVTDALPQRAESRSIDAALVARVRDGDPDAFGKLYDRWFDRVHDLAYRILWDREAAADVAQDAFLSAWNNIGTLQDAHAFGGWLLRIAHNGALNRKRKEQRARPVDDVVLTVLERTHTRPEDRLAQLDDPARVAEDTEIAALLWSAADALGDRDREVLDLHLRHGLAPAEIAEVTGLNRNAANQLVHRVKQRLGNAVGARVLWRDGVPTCSRLRVELEEAEVYEFGPEAVRIADRHVPACDECDERRRTGLAPATLFSAIPIMTVPFLKAKVAHALDAQGVPMQGFDPTALDTAQPPPGRGRRLGRWRRVLLASGASAAIVAGVVGLSASGIDHDGQIVVDEAASEETPTTTRASTVADATTTPETVSVVAPPPPPTTIATSPTTRPRALPPPAGPPPPPATQAAPPGVAEVTTPPTAAPTTTTPPRPIVTIDFTISTNPILPVFPLLQGPLLNWNVTGAARVVVSGPDFTASEPAGSRRICPGSLNQSILECLVRGLGPFNYVAEAYDANGQLVDSKVIVVTVLG